MDPAAYDEDAYRARLLGALKARELVVFDAAFAPDAAPGAPVLVAATSTGRIHVFELASALRPEYWTQGASRRPPTPALSFAAHPTQIYTLAFAGDLRDRVLVSGGDQDFRVWRWRDITTELERRRRRRADDGPEEPVEAPFELEPAFIGHLERKAMGYRGALLPFSEINDLAPTAPTSARLFLAGGDSRAHEWDLTTGECVRRFDGHDGYLHAVQYVNHSHELVTASEDGTIGIWDARSARRAATLRPGTTNNSGETDRWIGSLTTDASETWLACGGGAKGRRGNDTGGGFIGMWHLPSRVPVHVTATHAGADVQGLAFHHTDLVTVGNEPALRKWNRSSGAPLSAARTTVPSARFCAVDRASDLIALGGYAPAIDVCVMPGVVSFSLALAD